MSKGTPKLRTEKNEKVFGGKYGSINDNSRTVDAIALRTNTIFSVSLNFFILIIYQL